MPELPEVETIRGQLEKFLVGHKILEVEVRNSKIFTGNVKDLVGGKVTGVRRFAKVLSIDLNNSYSITSHIKLTGQYIYRGPNLKNPKDLSKKIVGGVPGLHTHVIFKLDKGGFLFYNDLRRFGWIRVIKTDEVTTSGFVGKLGPEPFNGLTEKLFNEILSKTKRPVKIVIMDQEKIGGVGNIYANDALWLSKINPKKPANELTDKEKNLLFDSILKVLKKGIEMGGASELSYVTPDGGEGSYQKHFLAYGKEGTLCPRCRKEKFKKYFLGGRGTYFCPECQKD